jgi:hypothetical protein
MLVVLFIDILLGLAMNGSDNNEYRKVLYVNLGSCDISLFVKWFYWSHIEILVFHATYLFVFVKNRFN